MSRSFVARPWAYLKLLKNLHNQQYDLVVQIGRGSFSGMTCMNSLHARYRVGAGKWAKAVCNIRVDLSAAKHAYDRPMAVARTLGMSCRNRPFYSTTQQEREKAIQRLSMVGLADGNNTIPFAALFVGGHKDKRWPIEYWIDLAAKLKQAHKRTLIFLGPEEMSMGSRVSEALGPGIPVFNPLPLRDFAAVLQQAHLVVTPDTGPMHLAVALDVPTIAIIQRNVSLRYAPRGDRDVVLRQPTSGQVFKSMQAHSVWPELSA
jgi:heptosyltransferase III